MENIIDDHESGSEQLVTFPDDDTVDELRPTTNSDLSICGVPNNESMLLPNSEHMCSIVGGSGAAGAVSLAGGCADTVKFEETRTTSASKSKVITDGYSSEQATSNTSEMKHLQAGDVDYREQTAAAAMRKKVEVDGVTAEQNAAAVQVSVRHMYDIHSQATNYDKRELDSNSRNVL